MNIICVARSPSALRNLLHQARQLMPSAAVHGCHSPDDAVTIAQREGCDVLLTDTDLKKTHIDGFMLAEKIQKIHPRVNIIFLTECTEGKYGVEAYRLHASGYLIKPYTALFAEYGDLDDIAYQSIVNLITLRKPTSWEAFLADFTELKDLETEDYTVNLDPDDETIAQIMGQRNGKYSYVLVRFGAEEYGEEAYEAFVPDAEAFADFYFRVVAGYQKGAAGDSLSEAQSACDVLAFATGNELWQADVETLRANMLEAWESLTDEERANFDANFPDLNELLIGCFADWEGSRSRFEDAGVLDTMEDLLADETAQQSWDTLSSHTWTLGNGE